MAARENEPRGDGRFIALLEMIEEKTEGNLTSEEGNFLKAQLTNLRLNFVNEANRAGASGGAARPGTSVGEDDEDEDDDGAAHGAAHGGARGAGAGPGRSGAEPHVESVGTGRTGKVVSRDDEGRPTVVDKRASSRSDDE